MEIKKMLTISAIGILFLTSVISFSQWRDAKKDITEITTQNTKLEEQNKKLLEANTTADQKIDELSKKYEGINEELKKIKEESQNNY